MQKRFFIFLAFLIGTATWQANANQISLVSVNSAAAGVGAGLYESFNSFSGETLIHTQDASGQAALKPISQIQIGDAVLAWDEQADFDAAAAKTTPTNALNSQNTAIQNTATPSPHHYEKVIDVISSHKQQTLIYISLDNGDTMTATQGHPFKTTEGWRDAILLKKGGKLLLKGGDDDKPPRPQAGEGGGVSAQTERYATITEVRTERKVLPVYNLEVANLHTYYVGQDGVVVHNARSSTSGETTATAAGRDYHKEPYPSGYEHEQTLPNGQRADAIDFNNKIIRERKLTDNPRTVRKAMRQVKGYCKQKPGFRGEVEIRSPSTGETSLFSVL